MDVQKITTEYRMNYWTEIIKECRSSGKTVKAWCEDRNIGAKSYYYWLRKLRIAACNTVNEKSILPVNSKTKSQPVFAEINVPQNNHSVAIVLKYNGVIIEVQDGVSRDTIENTMKALKSIC